MNTKIILKSVMLIIKGVFVGFGAIMPGISGGTLCAAFGMYKPLLNLYLPHEKQSKTMDYIYLRF